MYEQVLLRMLCDALGFTGESDKKVHGRLVQEAREWFYDGENLEDVELVCTFAGFNHERVRQSAQRLIAARQSGDHSQVPEYWRVAFARNRMPSFSAFAGAIDSQLQRS